LAGAVLSENGPDFPGGEVEVHLGHGPHRREADRYAAQRQERRFGFCRSDQNSAEGTVSLPATISARADSMRVHTSSGILSRRVGLTTKVTTFSAMPRRVMAGRNSLRRTSPATRTKAPGMSITALARMTSGAIWFWSLLVPKANTARACAAWKTPSPAASALWIRKSAPCWICAAA